ncbi:T9SS type A sorting domain-containing protein, partial [Ferruginibacter sp. HRS2-29]
QWQVSTDGGTTWSNVTGATSATLALTAVTTAMNNNQYRAVLNGTCTTNLNSTAVTLVVNTPVVITAQPVNVSTCSGTSATFGVTATGTTITYQWQVSVNNGPFVDIANGVNYSGVTTATLTVSNITTALNGYRYRVVANGVPCGGVTSAAATLTANPTPTVVLTAASYANYDPSISTGLFATTSPVGVYTYQWFKNNAAIGVTSASFPLSGDDFGEYYVIATNTNGCSHTSNKVTVADSASNLLFIYPNPNSGKFQVRYYNKGGSTIERKMVIYDSKGAQVYVKNYTVTGPYGRMDVELKKASAGIYVVELLDNSNNRVASGKVNIIKH